jgi:hypothetical protein
MVVIALVIFAAGSLIGAVVAARAALRFHRRVPRLVALIAAADAVATRAAEVEQSGARIRARTERVRAFGQAML